MTELSVFIDESGTFASTNDKNAYYLVTFVFHDQRNDINEEVLKLEKSTHESGFDVDYIHTGPVIRREDIFEEYSIDERRRLIYKIFNFVIKCPITYHTVAVNRREAVDKVGLSGKLGKAINTYIKDNVEYLLSFDKVIVYYDNGQSDLSAILNAVFSIWIPGVEFRKVEPQKYRLLQAADFFCSMELLRIKRDENRLSKTEEKFFYKPQELKKVFLKGIEKKRHK